MNYENLDGQFLIGGFGGRTGVRADMRERLTLKIQFAVVAMAFAGARISSGCEYFD